MSMHKLAGMRGDLGRSTDELRDARRGLLNRDHVGWTFLVSCEMDKD